MSAGSWSPDGSRHLRMAAVQTPAAQSVQAGLEHAAPLVARAADEGARLVPAPELMATYYVFTPHMWDSAEPTDGPTVHWLRETARRLGI